MSFEVINTQAYLTDEAKDYLEKNDCRIRFQPLDALDDEQFCRGIRAVDAVIAGGEWWTDKRLGSADKLKIVARTGAGVDHVDLQAAARHGIWVTNTPGATSRAVADFTLGLILSLLRNIPAMAADMKNGKWEQFCGKELGSLTLGVVGTGSIGKEVIVRARGFGAKILAYDIAPGGQFAAHWQVRYVSLDELMARSDIVSIHCALTEQTEGLINAENLELMKKEAYLVNTSRAGVVDKDALMAALQAKKIAGAAIDVHDPAPCAPDDPLVALDNVIATPWTAYKTEESIARMCITAVADLVTVLRGGRPRFPVNEPRTYNS